MLSWRAFPERAGAGPGAYLEVPALVRFGIRAIFTTRHGGFSDAAYASLNLSYASGDDAATVRRNRGRALEALGLEAGAWTGGRQVHGSEVAHVTDAQRGCGADSAATTIPDTDALWTEQPGAALAVVTADCVPVLLADPRARRVAVVHAGWRGLLAGVVPKAAAVFDDASRIVAVAGPSIGPCCYEVGPDVSAPATERFGDQAMRGGRLDLWGLAASACADAGIRTVTVAAVCTRCESHRFYSHRDGDAGRQALVAALIP